MSNNRSTRKSALASTAATPREAWQGQTEVSRSRGEAEEVRPQVEGEKVPAPTRKKKRPKVSFYADEDEQARANAAWLHTAGHTGHKTLTSFLEAAMIKYARELEREYNDSKPFS